MISHIVSGSELVENNVAVKAGLINNHIFSGSGILKESQCQWKLIGENIIRSAGVGLVKNHIFSGSMIDADIILMPILI